MGLVLGCAESGPQTIDLRFEGDLFGRDRRAEGMQGFEPVQVDEVDCGRVDSISKMAQEWARQTGIESKRTIGLGEGQLAVEFGTSSFEGDMYFA